MFKLFFITSIIISYCFAEFIKPEEGAILNYTYIDFHWEQRPNTSNYRLQVYDQDSTMVLDQNVDKTLYIDYNNFTWNKSYSAFLSIPQNDNGNFDWYDSLFFSIAPKISHTDLDTNFINNDLFQDGLIFLAKFLQL